MSRSCQDRRHGLCAVVLTGIPGKGNTISRRWFIVGNGARGPPLNLGKTAQHRVPLFSIPVYMKHCNTGTSHSVQKKLSASHWPAEQMGMNVGELEPEDTWAPQARGWGYDESGECRQGEETTPFLPMGTRERGYSLSQAGHTNHPGGCSGKLSSTYKYNCLLLLLRWESCQGCLELPNWDY